MDALAKCIGSQKSGQEKNLSDKREHSLITRLQCSSTSKNFLFRGSWSTDGKGFLSLVGNQPRKCYSISFSRNREKRGEDD